MRLGSMKTNLKLDIGFGDTIYPGPVEMEYPTLLDAESIRISSYSLESVIAEKFDAMIVPLWKKRSGLPSKQDEPFSLMIRLSSRILSTQIPGTSNSGRASWIGSKYNRLILTLLWTRLRGNFNPYTITWRNNCTCWTARMVGVRFLFL